MKMPPSTLISAHELLLDTEARRTDERQEVTQTTAGIETSTHANEATFMQAGESASRTGHDAVVKLDG